MCVKSQTEGTVSTKALWQKGAWWIMGEEEALQAGCGNPGQSMTEASLEKGQRSHKASWAQGGSLNFILSGVALESF